MLGWLNAANIDITIQLSNMHLKKKINMLGFQVPLDMDISHHDLHEFLELKYMQYNRPSFIEVDPVCIPHLFTKRQDIEIAGFLAATISWGNRKSIVANARRLVEMMDHDPHGFIMKA